ALGGYAYGAASHEASAPKAARAVALTAAHDARPYSYGWPVKPFDKQHPVRGSFGDPRSVFHGPPTMLGLISSSFACSYHQGIDISATDGTAVYPVRSGALTFRASDSGPELMPEYLHGRVEIVAKAWDTPAIPVPGIWHGLPVTPAHLTFHIARLPQRRVVVPETDAVDVRRSLPFTPDMWHTYARGTHMNFVQMGSRRYWFQPASYRFKLPPSGCGPS